MRHQLFSECAAKRFATDEAEIENDKPSQQKPLGAYSESGRCTKGRQAFLRGARWRLTGKTISATPKRGDLPHWSRITGKPSLISFTKFNAFLLFGIATSARSWLKSPQMPAFVRIAKCPSAVINDHLFCFLTNAK